MGRTVLPYSIVLEGELQKLKKFRRALRKEDQIYLDRLFSEARKQIQSGIYSAFSEPLLPILFSILIEHEKELDRLKRILCSQKNENEPSQWVKTSPKEENASELDLYTKSY